MKSSNLARMIVILCIVETSAKRIPSFAGPYRATLRRVTNESIYFKSTGKAWLRLHATQVRGKQPQYVWGSSFVSVPLNDEMEVKVMMASRSNNQWKENAFVFKFNRICTNAKVFGQSILDIMYGPDYNTNCPIKPNGLREIKNQTFEFKFRQFPIMPYGRYLFNLALILNSVVIGVIEADCEALPRLD